jgi:hypothetical protein
MSWLVRCGICLCVGLGLMLAPSVYAQEAPKKDDQAKKDDAKKDDVKKDDKAKKDDKKKTNDKKKGDEAKTEDKDKKDKDKKEEKPVFIGTLTGSVKRILNSDEDGTFIYLEVTIISPQLQVFARQPMTGYSLARRNRMSGNDYRGYIVPREVKQEYEVPVTELTKIRIPPKPEVDEKGKVIPPKTTLKRDKNDPEYGLPGEKGEITDLNRGQFLRVHLGQMKDPADPKGKKMVIVATMVEMLLDPSQLPQQQNKK